MEGKTVVAIAHRLSTIAAMDRLIVLDQRPHRRGGRPPQPARARRPLRAAVGAPERRLPRRGGGRRHGRHGPHPSNSCIALKTSGLHCRDAQSFPACLRVGACTGPVGPGAGRASSGNAMRPLRRWSPTAHWTDGEWASLAQAVRHAQQLGEAEAACVMLRIRWRALPVDGGFVAWLMPLQPADDADIQALREQVGRLTEQLHVAEEVGRLGVWERDIRSGRARWDEHMFRFFGFDPAQGTPTPEEAMRRLHPADRERMVAEYFGSMQQPGMHEGRYRVQLPDGRIGLVHIVWEVKTGEDGQPERLIGVMLDDTESVRAAQRHQAASTQIALAVGLVGISLWRIDIASRRIHLNDWGYELIGKVPHPDGMPLAEMRASVHPDDLPAIVQASEEALKSTGIVDTEARYRRPDGSYRTLLTRRIAERDESGKPIALVGVSLDVTEQVIARQRAQQATQSIELIAEATGVGVWTTDVQTRMPVWNQQMWRIFDVPEEHLAAAGAARGDPAPRPGRPRPPRRRLCRAGRRRPGGRGAGVPPAAPRRRGALGGRPRALGGARRPPGGVRHVHRRDRAAPDAGAAAPRRAAHAARGAGGRPGAVGARPGRRRHLVGCADVPAARAVARRSARAQRAAPHLHPPRRPGLRRAPHRRDHRRRIRLHLRLPRALARRHGALAGHARHGGARRGRAPAAHPRFQLGRHRAQARRGHAAREGDRRRGQPREERVPVAHEPRAAHAAERGARLRAADAAKTRRTACPTGSASAPSASATPASTCWR